MAFRRQIIDLLSREPRSASSIAREMGLRRGEIEEDLRHALRSAATAGHHIDIIPARCKDCGFTFAATASSSPAAARRARARDFLKRRSE